MAESQQLHQFAELYRKLKYAENHKIDRLDIYSYNHSINR